LQKNEEESDAKQDITMLIGVAEDAAIGVLRRGNGIFTSDAGTSFRLPGRIVPASLSMSSCYAFT
jgi:hypothetical protein